MNLLKKFDTPFCRISLLLIGFGWGISAKTHAELVTVEVVVKSVDVKDRMITVTETTKSKSKDIELEVSKRTKILIDKKNATLDAIKSGQKASVTFDEDLKVATKIESPGNAAGIKTAVSTQKEEAEFEDLFTEDGLEGWYLKKEVYMKPNQDINSIGANWENKEGVLTYKKSGPSIVSDKKFNDFEMELEFNLPKDCNCGIFLRGRYELKLIDTPKRVTNTLRPDNRMGAIYGRIAPSKLSYKGTNQWNKLEVKLVGKTVTVKMNEETIIDEQEIPGGVSGPIVIDTDEDSPGPIMFFAHPKGVGAKFRNIRIKQLEE